MSKISPVKKPMYIPSLRPRINPKEDTTTTKRLDDIEANDSVWNKVVCNKKQMNIMTNTVIFLLIKIFLVFCRLLLF